MRFPKECYQMQQSIEHHLPGLRPAQHRGLVSHVMVLLDYDGNIADYTAEEKMIDGKIPVLNVLSDKEGWTEPGKTWLAKNAPNSEVVVFGLHLMFWEFPDKFNAAVDAFLEKVK